MLDKSAYSIFRPVDLPTNRFLESNDTATSPFPEDAHGDPVSQLRAFRLNSHPLTVLAKARSAADIAALATNFSAINPPQVRLTPQEVQLANLRYYRSMFGL
jgi:hypothetical protein